MSCLTVISISQPLVFLFPLFLGCLECLRNVTQVPPGAGEGGCGVSAGLRLPHQKEDSLTTSQGKPRDSEIMQQKQKAANEKTSVQTREK